MGENESAGLYNESYPDKIAACAEETMQLSEVIIIIQWDKAGEKTCRK